MCWLFCIRFLPFVGTEWVRILLRTSSLCQLSGQRRVSSNTVSVSLAHHQIHFSSPSVLALEMRAATTERVSRIKALMAALQVEDTEVMSILQVVLDKAQRQAAVPPVDHQIKATEDSSGGPRSGCFKHDVDQRPRGWPSRRTSPTPQSAGPRGYSSSLSSYSRSELKNQSSTRLVELEKTFRQTRRVFACWMVSKQLEFRDALEMELSQLSSKGALRMECFPFHGFQHGLLKQVPPIHRALWGWRGVRVGEASNLGLV